VFGAVPEPLCDVLAFQVVSGIGKRVKKEFASDEDVDDDPDFMPPAISLRSIAGHASLLADEDDEDDAFSD
jgi:hypothetical protein